METECGIVIKSKANYVCVEASAVSFCSSCGNHQCSMRQSKGRQLWIENTLHATVGDRVHFVLPSKGVILSSIVLYGIPILGLITGIIVGTVWKLPRINDKEISGIIMGILFLMCSFFIMRVASKYIVQYKQIAPKMVRVERHT